MWVHGCLDGDVTPARTTAERSHQIRDALADSMEASEAPNKQDGTITTNSFFQCSRNRTDIA